MKPRGPPPRRYTLVPKPWSIMPTFTTEQQNALRPRFVLDRMDGNPVLVGHAQCPECSVSLVPGRTGTMEFRAEGIRLTLHVKCPTCRRRMDVQDDFDVTEEDEEWREGLEEDGE